MLQSTPLVQFVEMDVTGAGEPIRRHRKCNFGGLREASLGQASPARSVTVIGFAKRLKANP